MVAVGEMHLIRRWEELEQPWQSERLPDMIFSGAQLGPLVSWNSGDTHALTVAFYPDAFALMTGIELSAFTGRMVPAEGVLPPAILRPCRDFFAGVERDDVETSFARLEDAIETLWSETRKDSAGPTRWLKDWTRSLVIKAALSRPGRSSRQIARRIRSWTGVSARDLNGLGQSEQLYANIHEALEKGKIDWAGLAATSGYADQAHMIRRMRQHTGFTPEQLRRGAKSDEAMWGYRLLSQYFSKP